MLGIKHKYLVYKKYFCLIVLNPIRVNFVLHITTVLRFLTQTRVKALSKVQHELDYSNIQRVSYIYF